MIWIRADANSEIGTGHVMRCLSIASALLECGQQVCFVVADESAVKLLESRGMDYRILHSEYREMEAELPQLCGWLQSEQISCMLIDSYFVTKEYLEQVRRYIRTVYVDDMNKFPYPVDALINYNIYGDLLPYREQIAESERSLLLGTTYVPLRAEFRDVGYEVRAEVQKVLITTGGSDKYNLAGQILEKLLQDDRTGQLQYHVVSGAFNQYLPSLKAIEAEYTNVQIHQNVTKMSELMQECDVALTAGGSTMYELSAVGVPIICFSFVDNQEQIVRTFAHKEVVCYGGDYLREQEAMFDEVLEHLVMLKASKAARQMYSQKEQQLVDGQGAMRIAQFLIELGTE